MAVQRQRDWTTEAAENPAADSAERSRLGGLAAVGAVCISVGVMFHGLLLGRLPACNDVVTNDLLYYNYPLRCLYAESLKHGRLLTWTPLIHGGLPIFAEGQGGFLYPPNIILGRLYSPAHAICGYIILHAIIAGLATYRLGRRLTRDAWAPIPSAVAASLSGPIVCGHIRHLNALAPIALAPLLLDCVEEWNNGRGVAPAARFGLVFGWMLLAGHPQYAFIAVSVAVLYALARVCWDKPAKSRTELASTVRLAILAIALGLAIGSPQLIATAGLVQGSARASDMPAGFTDRGSMPWSGIRTFLDPYYDGDAGDATYRGSDLFMFWEGNHYCSVVIVLAAVLGFCAGWRTAAVRALASVGAVAYLLAVGSHFPLYGLLRHLPLVGAFRYPVRWLLGSEYAILGLSAYGMCAACKLAKSSRLIAVVSLTVAAAVAGQIHLLEGRQLNTIDLHVALTGASEIASHLTSTNQDGLPPWRGGLGRSGLRVFTLGDAEAQSDAYVRSRGWERDTSGYADAAALMPPNLSAAYGIPTIQGYTSLAPRSTYAVWGDAGHYGVVSGCSYVDTAGRLQVRPGLLKLMRMWHVGFINSLWPLPAPYIPIEHSRSVYCYAVPDALPTAWTVRDGVAIPSGDDLRAARTLLDPRFDPSSMALISGGCADMPRNGQSGPVDILDVGGDGSLTLRSVAAGLVVVSNSWDQGWRATVDGHPSKVYRVNVCMQGVVAPRAGAVIRLTYGDAGLRWQIAISIALSIAAIFAAWRRR